MNKIFYISYNDLDIPMKDEILDIAEQYVWENLKKEGNGGTDWKEKVKALYDFETIFDLDIFVSEKAEDMVTTAFRNIPFELELKFQ